MNTKPPRVIDRSLPQGAEVLHVGPRIDGGTTISWQMPPAIADVSVSAEYTCLGCGRRAATRSRSRRRSVEWWAWEHSCPWVTSRRERFGRKYPGDQPLHRSPWGRGKA